MQNFSSDIRSGDILASILSSLANGIDGIIFADEDIYEREKTILKYVKNWNDQLFPILQTGDIAQGHGDRIFVFLVHLWMSYPQLSLSMSDHSQNRMEPWNEASEDLVHVAQTWNWVRQSWIDYDKGKLPSVLQKLPDALGTVGCRDLHDATSALIGVIKRVHDTCAARQHKYRVWRRLQTNVQAAAWEMLAHDSLTGIIPDRKEAREKAMYTCFDVHKLTLQFQKWGIEAVDIPREIERCQTLFTDHYQKIRHIFQHYAASEAGDATSISMDEFYAFLKDSKLISKNLLPLSHVQDIFETVNDAGESVRDPVNPDYELTPSEFVEAIVHVAERRCRKTENGSTSSLYLRVKKCLIDFVLPHACCSNSDYFRKKLREPNCHKVFSFYKEHLQGLYRTYAGTGRLSEGSFAELLNDCELISDLFTHHDLEKLFNKIQQDDSAMLSMGHEMEEASNNLLEVCNITSRCVEFIKNI